MALGTKQKKSNILKVNDEIYKVLEDGTYNIKLVKIDLTERAQGKELIKIKYKRFKPDVKDENIYSATMVNNQTATSSVGQLIRAVSPEKVEEINLDELKGQVVTIELVTHGAFQNIVSVVPFVEDGEDDWEDEEDGGPEDDEIEWDEDEERDTTDDEEYTTEEPVLIKKIKTSKANLFRETKKSSKR